MNFESSIITIIFFACLLCIVPFILFLLHQQNTLKNVQAHNRTMAPGQVWLQLIPLFGMVWQFIVVTRISESIKRELDSNSFSFEATGQSSINYDSKPTYGIGITYCILFCCGIIPMIGTILTLAGLVCWIIYWVQLSSYKSKLEQKNYALASPPSMP